MVMLMIEMMMAMQLMKVMMLKVDQVPGQLTQDTWWGWWSCWWLGWWSCSWWGWWSISHDEDDSHVHDEDGGGDEGDVYDWDDDEDGGDDGDDVEPFQGRHGVTVLRDPWGSYHPTLYKRFPFPPLLSFSFNWWINRYFPKMSTAARKFCKS